MKSIFKHFTIVGPGGLSCPCCAPQSGNKYAAQARIKMKRQAKRRLAVQIDRDVAEQLRELSNNLL